MKIVVLTVLDDYTDLFAALRYGVDGYLLKTMNFDRLPDALNGVCSGEAATQLVLVACFLSSSVSGNRAGGSLPAPGPRSG